VQFLKSAAISAVLYAAGFAATAVALFIFLGAWRSPEETPSHNLLLAGYMLAFTAIPAAVGFGLATSWSKTWRVQSRALRTWLSLAAGALTQLLYLTGLALLPGNLLFPRDFGTLTMGFKLLLPGILVGLFELGIARLLQPRVVS
jgi:hypothetical protein